MRIGKDGKTSVRRTGRRWRKPTTQFGEKVLFRKIREDGVSSLASRMTQRIFVGHHGRTGAILCAAQNGVVRGKSWTRQTLSDAWESTNWEVLCGAPWQMVAPELKLTNKVTADKERAGPPMPRIVVGRAKLNPEDCTSCLRTMKLTDALEAAQDAQRLRCMEKRQCHNESERSFREP